MSSRRVLALVLPGLALAASAALGAVSAPNSITVRPGETKSNGAVTVVNSSQQIDSNANAKISPKSAGGGVPDKVSTDPHFAGTISGVGPGDQVNLGNDSGDPNVEALVYGTGGDVSITGTDSHVTVVNQNTDPNGPSITVTDPDGTHSVPPNGSFHYPHP